MTRLSLDNDVIFGEEKGTADEALQLTLPKAYNLRIICR